VLDLTTESACHVVLYSLESYGQRRNLTGRTWKSAIVA